MFEAIKRATLLYPTPASFRSPLHFFVLLTDPYEPIDQVIMACICSVPTKTISYDTTCTLGVGDHDFIDHPSFVDYRYCREEPANKLKRGIESGEFVDKGLIDEEVFKRILAGALESPFTKPFVKTVLKSN